MVGKRKSTGEGSAEKKVKREKDDDDKNSEITAHDYFEGLSGHFRTWLQRCLDVHATLDNFFKETFPSKESIAAFLKFVEENFPPEAGVHYASPGALATPGPAALRPWNFPWDRSCGLKGLIEPDQVAMLCELMVLEGMKTNADQAGGERIAISRLYPEFGAVPSVELGLDVFDGAEVEPSGMLKPHGCFVVKGFTRMFCANLVLLCCYQCPDFMKALEPPILRSFRTVHCTVLVTADVGQLFMQNRSITFQSSLRRKPNCFNLLHQMQMMSKMKCEEVTEEWEGRSQIAAAYNVGRSESGAAHNLLSHVDPDVCESLATMVQKYTMAKFITHEAICGGIFNRDHNTASGQSAAWEPELHNTPEVLALLLERMERDFISLSVKMRTAYKYSMLETLQQKCAAFLACMSSFSRKYPSEFVDSESDRLYKTFMFRHCDDDLMKLLAESAPPADVDKVACFRAASAKYLKKVEAEKDKAAEEYAERLASANVQQTETKVNQDVAKLTEYVQNAQAHANRQGGLDLRYMADRYSKGKAFTTDFMATHQRYVSAREGLVDAHADILTWQSTVSGSGTGYTIMIMDASAWPTRPMVLDEAMEVAKAIGNSNHNAIIVALEPIHHSSADKITVTKNQRLLEDRLMQTMDATQLSVTFKDSQHAGDRRKQSQRGVIAVSPVHKGSGGFQKSKCFLGAIGPVSRARVMDLWSDDPEKGAPGASARAAQRGVTATKQILESLVDGLNFPADSVTPVFVVDLIGSRYNEWGRACWQLQKQLLDGQGNVDWHFAMYVGPDDFAACNVVECSKWMNGHIMSEHWDSCDAAGPATRTREKFAQTRPALEILVVENGKVKLPTAVQESLGVRAASLDETLGIWNSEYNLDLMVAASRPNTAHVTSASTPGQDVPRTLCRPEFSGADAPLNFRKTWESPTSLQTDAFGLDKVPFAQCSVCSHETLKAVLAADGFELWLLNDSDSPVEIGPAELFGFNLGSFSEKSPGIAGTVKDKSIPFLIKSDTDSWVHVANGGKVPTCLANLACDAAAKLGLTELSLDDHGLVQVVDQDSHPVPFRYTVTPNKKINFFEPKPLAGTVNMLELRHTMFGAAFLTEGCGLSKVPKTNRASTLWEVTLEHAQIKSIKPKFWLTCTLKMAANSAICLTDS